jgi:hypothetical protein
VVVPSDGFDFGSSEQAVTATLRKHVSTMEAHVVRKDWRKFMGYLSEIVSALRENRSKSTDWFATRIQRENLEKFSRSRRSDEWI